MSKENGLPIAIAGQSDDVNVLRKEIQSFADTVYQLRKLRTDEAKRLDSILLKIDPLISKFIKEELEKPLYV